jgi:hypothetical protein
MSNHELWELILFLAALSILSDARKPKEPKPPKAADLFFWKPPKPKPPKLTPQQWRAFLLTLGIALFPLLVLYGYEVPEVGATLCIIAAMLSFGIAGSLCLGRVARRGATARAPHAPLNGKQAA